MSPQKKKKKKKKEKKNKERVWGQTNLLDMDAHWNGHNEVMPVSEYSESLFLVITKQEKYQYFCIKKRRILSRIVCIAGSVNKFVKLSHSKLFYAQPLP